MRKILPVILLLSCLGYNPAGHAKETDTRDYNAFFVPFDLVIFRPLGLATTIVGSALFIATSPITALSSIAPPHDAFARAADALIVVPVTYTFLRPLGKFLCPGDCRPEDIQ